MSMPGPWELGLILVIILIFFGTGKLPQVLGQMGKGIKSFKDGMRDGENGEDEDDLSSTANRSDQNIAPAKKILSSEATSKEGTKPQAEHAAQPTE
ncbi:MAG: twin-arginine translocase TatA/TatE family subunit [Proteobacteria bacterium]|nr:twin-arginine translocase TatA/TatE family subunit [Pseudomonadota bacterium]